jgi:hypothetical protein
MQPALEVDAAGLGSNSRTLQDANCDTIDCIADAVADAAEDQDVELDAADGKQHSARPKCNDIYAKQSDMANQSIR